MERFSERMGIAPAKLVQLDGMDERLRNGIWNAFRKYFLPKDMAWDDPFEDERAYVWFRVIYEEILGLMRDELPWRSGEALEDFRQRFSRLKWNEVYEMIEFLGSRERVPDGFTAECNRVFERERSGYRFAGGILVRITNPIELGAVERGMGDASVNSIGAATEHLRAAAELMGSRDNPNFRNSVKESISAVEAVVRDLTGEPKATLGDALDDLEPPLHPALAKGLAAIYGWTSDGGGIRHALAEGSTVKLEDAQLMLSTCAALISYLVAKNARSSS
jgi:hypothetical protein